MTNQNKKIDTKELLEEFIDLYKNPPQNIPSNTEAMFILAGDRPPIQGENVSRIKYTLTLLKKLKKNIPIIFSGITEEKETAINLMISLGIPKEICHFQDCGPFGIANTKTQFETFITDPLTRNIKSFTIITNTCYIPRVKRTAGKFLSPKIQFTVIGDPKDWKLNNSFLLVISEIEKIEKYSAKGDILI